MADIKNPAVLWIKGFLFLALGLLASGLLVLQAPHVTVYLLHLLAIWAFCRSYYFAFYVIEHYMDPGYRFAGLLSFVRYVAAARPRLINTINQDLRRQLLPQMFTFAAISVHRQVPIQ